MLQNYMIMVRDDKGRYIDYLDDYISLSIVDTLNDTGRWKIEGKSKSECPIKPGYGIIVYCDGRYFYSGVLKSSESKYDPISESWNWVATGVNDFEYLRYRVIIPTGNERYYVLNPETYDYRINDIIRKLIFDSIIDTIKYPGRKIEFIKLPLKYELDPVGRELPILYFRYDNLYTVVSNLLSISGYRMSTYWEKENLYFDFALKKNISETCIFDINSKYVNSITHLVQFPQYTHLIASCNLELENMEDKDTALVDDAEVWKLNAEATTQNADQWGHVEEAYEVPIESFQKNTQVGSQRYLYDFTYNSLHQIAYDRIKEVLPSDGYVIDIDEKYFTHIYNSELFLGDKVGIAFSQSEIVEAELISVSTEIAYGSQKITPTFNIFRKSVLNEQKTDIENLQEFANENRKSEKSLTVSISRR